MKIISTLAFITIVSLPLYFLRCKSFSWCASPIPFTLLEILIVATFSAWLTWVIYLIRKKRESLSKLLNRLKNPFLIPIAVLIILSTLSLFVTSDLKGGLGIWKAYFLEGLALYLVVTDLSLRKKSFLWVLTALILSGLLVSIFSLLRFGSSVSEIGLDEATNLRITSFYDFANAVPLYLGPIAALTVSVILSQYNNPKNRIIFYLSLISLVFILGSIVLSQSKGGMVGVFAILIVWFGYLVYKSLTVKYRKFFRNTLYVTILLYFLLNIMIYINIDSLAPRVGKAGNSLVNRYCIWQGTRDLLSDKFITGSGLNGYHLDYKEYQTCLKNDYQYPHNILLTFWTEIGFLGLLAFLWVSYVYLKTNSKGKDEILSVGLLAAFVYIFVHGLVDVPYFKNDLSAEFWILLALVTINYKLPD